MSKQWWQTPRGNIIPMDHISQLEPSVPGQRPRYRNDQGMLAAHGTQAPGDPLVYGSVDIPDSGTYWLTEQEYKALAALLLHDDYAGVHADYLDDLGFAEAALALRQQFGGGTP